MSKKIFSLLCAAMIFLSGSAFACMKNNIGFASSAVIQNDIHFVKDYSKLVTDVCKNFVDVIISMSACLWNCQKVR